MGFQTLKESSDGSRNRQWRASGHVVNPDSVPGIVTSELQTSMIQLENEKGLKSLESAGYTAQSKYLATENFRQSNCREQIGRDLKPVEEMPPSGPASQQRDRCKMYLQGL